MSEADVLARIELVRGDITRESVDAIVNAANTTLLGGGGVDGAIHRAAGPELLTECRALGGCPTGSAQITRGYRLPARYVIHTVGPVYSGGDRGEADLLASCYRTSLQLAAEHNCRTVAFPAVSCGVYGYPLDEAADVSIRAVVDFLRTSELPERVRWVLFDSRAYDAYEAALR
jgi:O-acetyl-ADP-ribose deacetylase (regulator of RNase III)